MLILDVTFCLEVEDVIESIAVHKQKLVGTRLRSLLVLQEYCASCAEMPKCLLCCADSYWQGDKMRSWYVNTDFLSKVSVVCWKLMALLQVDGGWHIEHGCFLTDLSLRSVSLSLTPLQECLVCYSRRENLPEQLKLTIAESCARDNIHIWFVKVLLDCT